MAPANEPGEAGCRAARLGGSPRGVREPLVMRTWKDRPRSLSAESFPAGQQKQQGKTSHSATAYGSTIDNDRVTRPGPFLLRAPPPTFHGMANPLSAWKEAGCRTRLLCPEWTRDGPADRLPQPHLLASLPTETIQLLENLLANVSSHPGVAQAQLLNAESILEILPNEPALLLICSYYLASTEDMGSAIEAGYAAQAAIGGPGIDPILDQHLAKMKAFHDKEIESDVGAASGCYDDDDWVAAPYERPPSLEAFCGGSDLARTQQVRKAWNAATPNAVARFQRYLHIETNIFEGVFELDDESVRRLTCEDFHSNAIAQCDEDTAARQPLDFNAQKIVAILKDCELVLQRAGEIAREPSKLDVPELHAMHRQVMRHDRFMEADDEDLEGAPVKVPISRRIGACRLSPCWTSLLEDDHAIVQFAPAAKVSAELEAVMPSMKDALTSPAFRQNPWLVAAYLHHAFVTVHPYSDGNGRIARYLASIPLLAAGLPPVLMCLPLKAQYLAALNTARHDRNLGQLVAVLQQGALTGIDYVSGLPGTAKAETRLVGFR